MASPGLAWRTALVVLDEGGAGGQPWRARVQVVSMAGNLHLDRVAVLRDRYPSLPDGTRVGSQPGSEALGPGNWVAALTWGADHDIAPLLLSET